MEAEAEEQAVAARERRRQAKAGREATDRLARRGKRPPSATSGASLTSQTTLTSASAAIRPDTHSAGPRPTAPRLTHPRPTAPTSTSVVGARTASASIAFSIACTTMPSDDAAESQESIQDESGQALDVQLAALDAQQAALEADEAMVQGPAWGADEAGVKGPAWGADEADEARPSRRLPERGGLAGRGRTVWGRSVWEHVEHPLDAREHAHAHEHEHPLGAHAHEHPLESLDAVDCKPGGSVAVRPAPQLPPAPPIPQWPSAPQPLPSMLPLPTKALGLTTARGAAAAAQAAIIARAEAEEWWSLSTKSDESACLPQYSPYRPRRRVSASTVVSPRSRA